MATILLAEAQKLGLNDLQAGIATTIATNDDLMAILPFNTTRGNAYAYNREGVPGNVASLAIGGSTSGVKTQVTFTNKTLALTSIIGDAEVNSLIAAQGVGANAGNDPVAAAIASKAKQVAREFARQVAVGNSASPGNSVSSVANTQEFDGLETLFASDSAFSGQIVNAADAALTFDMLDEAIDLVKVGTPNFIMGTSKAIRKIKALLRASGGVDYMDVAGYQIPMYNGIPLVRNDFLTSDVDGSTSGVQTNLYVGAFDDGSRTMGLSGIVPSDFPFVNATDVGEAETGDYRIWRVKMYGAMAVHSVLSVAQVLSATV